MKVKKESRSKVSSTSTKSGEKPAKLSLTPEQRDRLRRFGNAFRQAVEENARQRKLH